MNIKELSGKSVMAGIEVDFEKKTITPMYSDAVIVCNHIIGVYKIGNTKDDISAAAKRMTDILPSHARS